MGSIERPCHDCPLTNIGQLSPRQREVVEHLIKGLSNKEIAKLMSVAEGTVKMLLHTTYTKTGTKNRTALAMMFNGKTVVPPPPTDKYGIT